MNIRLSVRPAQTSVRWQLRRRELRQRPWTHRQLVSGQSRRVTWFKNCSSPGRSSTTQQRKGKKEKKKGQKRKNVLIHRSLNPNSFELKINKLFVSVQNSCVNISEFWTNVKHFSHQMKIFVSLGIFWQKMSNVFFFYQETESWEFLTFGQRKRHV